MKKILNITNGDCARTRKNFCAISLQKQAIFGDMWQQWRAITLLILLPLFVVVFPCLPM